VALADLLDVLRCPVCTADFEPDERVLCCGNGHSFDVARQGYVNLLTGTEKPGTADTSHMVAARAEFLAAGHYGPVVDAIAGRIAPDAQIVLDAGAGTGYYLTGVLEATPQAGGLALDISKFAARRAARAHPRIAAAVCDTWQALPVRDESADVILNVFAPRNGPEFARALNRDGVLTVVTPTRRHLAELAAELGMLDVDARKEARVERALAEHFEPVDRAELNFPLRLGTADVERLVQMGPSAWHLDAGEAARRAATLGTEVAATASVTIASYRPRRRRP
jgi:23S rRNA (guanine745-N1)-methyltransferase